MEKIYYYSQMKVKPNFVIKVKFEKIQFQANLRASKNNFAIDIAHL